MVQVERIAAVLASSEYLRDVPAPILARLAANTNQREVKQGHWLWRQGDHAGAFHLIAHGLVSVHRAAPSGSEVILGIFGRSDAVGTPAAFQRATFPAGACVLSETAHVLAIDAASLLSEERSCRELAQGLQLALLHHNDALMNKVQILAAGSVKARLASLLLHLLERFGEPLADGSLLVPVSLSRMALASLISARTETIIRTMRPWEDAGVLSTEDFGFRVRRPEVLRAAMAEG